MRSLWIARHGNRQDFAGHGITVQGVLQGLLDDVPHTGCPLASLTHLVQDDTGWRLAERNDTSHLESGAQAPDRMA